MLIGELSEAIDDSADDGTELDTEVWVQLDKNCVPVKGVDVVTNDNGVPMLLIRPGWNGEKVHFNE